MTIKFPIIFYNSDDFGLLISGIPLNHPVTPGIKITHLKLMSQLKFELLPDEKIIDTWTLLYIPPNGGKYNGKCTVTNLRILYDAKFDYSVKGIIEESLFIKWGSEGFLVIPKNRIANVEVKKSFLDKRVMLTLDNGQIHTFSYGAMNIDKVVDAIKN
jgi:hypothetical protein